MFSFERKVKPDWEFGGSNPGGGDCVRHCLGDFLPQRINGEGFDNVVVYPRLDGFDHPRFFRFGRTHDDGGLLIAFANLPDQGDAIHIGHVPIDDHELGFLRLIHFEGLQSVGGLDDVGVSKLLEDVSLNVANGSGIINEENLHACAPAVSRDDDPTFVPTTTIPTSK